MSASSDKLRILVPEFASIIDFPDEVVDTFLEVAASLHDAGAWGIPFGTAMIYFASHLLSKVYPDGVGSSGGSGAGGGAVTSKKAGDLAVSFGSASAGVMGGTYVGDVSLMETTYGRLYLHIRGGRADRGPTLVRA